MLEKEVGGERPMLCDVAMVVYMATAKHNGSNRTAHAMQAG